MVRVELEPVEAGSGDDEHVAIRPVLRVIASQALDGLHDRRAIVGQAARRDVLDLAEGLREWLAPEAVEVEIEKPICLPSGDTVAEVAPLLEFRSLICS